LWAAKTSNEKKSGAEVQDILLVLNIKKPFSLNVQDLSVHAAERLL
jgi:hypothetical protein